MKEDEIGVLVLTGNGLKAADKITSSSRCNVRLKISWYCDIFLAVLVIYLGVVGAELAT